MQFTLVLLGCLDRIPDHLSMFQASRNPWDTGFLYRGINKPVVHEEACHSASDNTKEDLTLYIKQRDRAKFANANLVLLFGDLDAIRKAPVLRYQVLFPGSLQDDRELAKHERTVLIQLVG